MKMQNNIHIVCEVKYEKTEQTKDTNNNLTVVQQISQYSFMRNPLSLLRGRQYPICLNSHT